MSSTMARDPDIERTTDPLFWQATFEQDPEIMHRILGDLWRAVTTARGHTGRLPTSVEELFELVLPEYSNDPFPIALKAKLGKRSIRWLAGQIHLHHSHVHRWVTGQRDIVSLHNPQASMEQIEAIARALGTHPSYFAEWRRLWILQLLDSTFATHPNLSVGLWKRFGVFSTKPLNGR